MEVGQRAARNGRRPTATSSFGVGRRESHDARGFYDRFVPPDVSDDVEVRPPAALDRVWVGDARHMDDDKVADKSVALVVTSPPYFAGKEYETALGDGHVPGSYLDYLRMLEDVFAECVRKLEPGGRIAVNVANLGRRPYRSLSSDVVDILERKLRLLMRGEVIWWKGHAAGGSCAWGTFQRPGNPVLRDVTERVIIASKGRFDRALSPRQREAAGLPSEASIWREEFLEATTDVWEILPESARRVNHPAPFPVALPLRLIELYTYRCDLVLDPFMGSGSTAVAATRAERHFVGFDTDPRYKAIADERVAAERNRLDELRGERGREPLRVVLPATRAAPPEGEDFQARAVREGRNARDLASAVLEACGFRDIQKNVAYRDIGVEVNLVAFDKAGECWRFDVSGAFSSTRPGLRRTDTLWKALGKAAVLHAAEPGIPLVLLTTDAPVPGSAGAAALAAMCGEGKGIHDVVEFLDEKGVERLRDYAAGR